MTPENSPLPDEFEVRLFPLPKVVLFPGMILPLLVFEPRYRALVADALSSDRLVGVPRLVPGHDAQYFASPPICQTFGVGRIVDDVRLPDGRYRIVLSGQGRVELLTEVSADPYRVARVKQRPTHGSETTPATLALRASVLGQASVLTRGLGEEGERLLRIVNQAPTAAQCASLIAASLVADDAVRQAVLEADTVQSQLELLVGHLHATAVRLDTSARPSVLN